MFLRRGCLAWRLEKNLAHYSISECPDAEASINGVRPSLSWVSTAAPFWINNCTISRCPYRDAAINGVQPSLSWVPTAASFWITNLGRISSFYHKFTGGKEVGARRPSFVFFMQCQSHRKLEGSGKKRGRNVASRAQIERSGERLVARLVARES
jgi:hypothetical protein